MVTTTSDPMADWLAGQVSALLSATGPKRSAKAAALTDNQSKLNYLMPIAHQDELLALNQYLQGHAKPTPVAATPATPAVPAGPTREQQLSSARNLAAQRAEMYIRQQGLDPTTYMPMIQNEFQRIQDNLLPTDDPRNAFNDTIASSVLTGEQQRQRNDLLRTVDAKFNPGFEDTAVPNGILDDTISSILSEQRQGALDYLNRGKARGIYNDVGYNAGLSSVNNAGTVGRSDLSSLGGTVIDKYRGQLDSIGDEAHSAASGFELGRGNFSLDPYIGEYNDVLGRANTNAAGDLRGLLGGRNYFDLPKLTNAAGQAQGALNLRDADLATAVAERKRQNTLGRGLGSQGAF